MACRQCNNDPCSLAISRQMLDDSASTCEQAMQPSASRHYLYRAFTRSEYGYLGAGNRIIIPVCVRDYIRSLFPDKDGNYTGHRDANLGESSLSGLIIIIRSTAKLFPIFNNYSNTFLLHPNHPPSNLPLPPLGHLLPLPPLRHHPPHQYFHEDYLE